MSKPGRRLYAAGAAMAAALLGSCGSASGPSTPVMTGDPSCAMTETAIPNEGWIHVPEGSSVVYQANPPASGPHYPVWLRYQAYEAPLPRPYWVHNLEHGAIVLLHRTDAPTAGIAALNDTLRALPNDPECSHPRALLVPDPLLPRPFAAVAANFTLLGDCVNGATIQAFAVAHRNRAPEDICESGTRP